MNLETVRMAVRGFDQPADRKSRELVEQLLDWSAEPFSRHQFAPGHITCTGLVVDAVSGSILLVQHRRLQRWLLPGGHVELEDESIADAARREVLEETGIACDEEWWELAGIDVHGIPSNGREPYHLHHDLVIRLRPVTTELVVSPEAKAAVWCPAGDIGRYSLPVRVVQMATRRE